MKLYTKENKVISILRNHNYVLPVLNRFDIRPGVHDKTIEEICSEKQIVVNFFLAIVNTYAYPQYFPKQELLSFSPVLIIDYLKKTHAYYRNYVIPSIDASLTKLIASSNSQKSDIHLLKTFYEGYKKEFLAHNENEERHIFPYILNILDNPHESDGRLASKNYEHEHHHIENKIEDLKNLLLKYMDTDYDDNLYNDFIFKLFMFEKDAKDHARIEDAILLPIARTFERI